MPWFYGYGWIFPLVFLVFFLVCIFVCFFIFWRRAHNSDSPGFACRPPLQGKFIQKDSEYYESEIDELKLEIENLENKVNDENKKSIEEQILELEKKLENLKNNTIK